MGYIFDPEKLHTLSKRVVGLPRQQMITQLISDLAEAYPGYIETRQKWIFNLVGGATGSLTVLHGSLSEYLIIFGTSIGTEGFSGRYRLEIHDFMLEGEMWVYTGDKPLEREVFVPGEHAILNRNQTKAYRCPDSGWMLEYARGNVPSCLPTGLGGAVFSAVDPKIVWDTVSTYGWQTIRSLLKGKI
jgi:hypothetical protein